MVEQTNNEKKPIDLENSIDFKNHLERYLNPDDYNDNFNPLGAAIFKETLGFSIEDLLDSDNSVDDIEETKTTEGDNND